MALLTELDVVSEELTSLSGKSDYVLLRDGIIPEKIRDVNTGTVRLLTQILLAKFIQKFLEADVVFTTSVHQSAEQFNVFQAEISKPDDTWTEFSFHIKELESPLNPKILWKIMQSRIKDDS